MSPSRNDADEDLNDLLKDGKTDNYSSQMQPLNLDHLSQGELDVPVKRYNHQAPPCSILGLGFAYLSFACDYAPRFCCTLAIAGLIAPAYFLVMAVFLNPTENFGIVKHDFTSIQSQYDLSVGNIDHWCIKGDNDSCRCEDPLQPQPKAEFRPWTKAHQNNVNIIADMMDQGRSTPDIAFFGASVVEEMDGRWFGDDRDDQLKDMKKLFERNFVSSKGGKMDAVALGIAGDTSASLLWRLLHGEMPPEFNPKIWWLEIGMNDLGRAQCSEEVVVLGVLRIVEEILNQKPDTKIVINSLFPMSKLRGGMQPKTNDFKTDAQKRAERKRDGKRVRDHPKKEKGNNKRGQHRYLPESSRELFWKKPEKPVKMRDDKIHQKKYNPITHKERKLPLWTSITAINKELRKFATKHDQVDFFDSSKMFLERDGKYQFLKMDMISPRGHMTPAGFREWESAVIAKAQVILKGTN